MASSSSVLDETLAGLGLTRFHAPAPKPGGLVHVFQVLEERSLLRLAGLSETYAAPDGIEFGFADHREFNALAQRTTKDVVCFYAAAVRTMWSLCNAVMTIREIFPWIDDIDRLGIHAPPPKGELFFVQQTSAASETEMPVRRKLAAALFDSAMDFLLMHEVGHLWNGHVDWLHRRRGPLPFREMGLFDANDPDLSAAGALEFDADSFAVQKVFARAYIDNRFEEFSQDLLKSHRVPLDGAHTASWFFSWFSIYALFRAFDEACAVAGISARPHPPAELRQASLLSTVAAVSKRQGWSGLDINQWATLASAAGLEAEGAFCRLRGTTLDSATFAAAWDGPAFDLVDCHLRTWESLGPELALFKRGAMPAETATTPAAAP